jgi:SAM-dependent MidA family methyltransferase
MGNAKDGPEENKSRFSFAGRARRITGFMLEASPNPSAPIPERAVQTFEAWMREALYGDKGYYTHHIRAVGRRGDFSTSATLFPELGRAIARWAKQRSRELHLGLQWHLIEIGPGDGSLAETVLKSLGWWARHIVQYHLVDVEGPLRRSQEEKLRPYHVRWHTRVEDALQAAGGSALLFSNELVDAFPCVCAQWNADSQVWNEVGLRFTPTVQEIGLELDAKRLARFPSSALARTDWPQGQRVEIHWSYGDWLAAWRPLWQRGAMLTIDYGQTVEPLYYRRPRGSLRAYWQHQRWEGGEIYLRPGRQDITADVNFTDLIAWGESCGLSSLPLRTQGLFLGQYAPAEAGPDSWGAGEAFQVLEQTPQNAGRPEVSGT